MAHRYGIALLVLLIALPSITDARDARDVRNITQIANPASASSSATTVFTYDALNRLLQASTTAADSSPYKQQFEYDTLGSILAMATNGAASSTYSYSLTGNANPHAVTQTSNGVSTTTYTYDANGNLAQKVTDNITTTYLWDYANRLTALGVNGATSTYGYDAFGARVYQIASSTATTTYASKWYSVATSTSGGITNATTTEYIFNGDTLLAFVDTAGTSTPVVRYVHPDHLGSTNIVTNSSGTAVVQTLDYYPYGATRISTSAGGANSARKYIGQFADNSGLDYLNARYYNQNQAQFLTQDPVYLLIGDPKRLAERGGQDMQKLLEDPQMMNSYSYGRDNPIRYSDKNGQCVELFSAAFCTTVFYLTLAYTGAELSIGGYDVYLTYLQYPQSFSNEDRSQSRFNLGYNAALTTLGLGAPGLGLANYGKALETLSIGLDALEAFWGKKIYEDVNRKKEIQKQKTSVASNSPGASTPSAQTGGNSRQQAAGSTQPPGGSYTSSGQSQRNSGVSQVFNVAGFAPFRIVGTSAAGQTLYCSGACGN